jgi:hypothetical protein
MKMGERLRVFGKERELGVGGGKILDSREEVQLGWMEMKISYRDLSHFVNIISYTILHIY